MDQPQNAGFPPLSVWHLGAGSFSFIPMTRRAKRILWVDDEIDLLRPHLLFLQQRGYHVDAITNGDDGLALLRKDPYDLVLLDEQMPGISGLEVLEVLSREDPHARVVMVSKSEEDRTMTEAIGRRVDAYLVKPTSPRQVLSVVTRILEGSAIRQQRAAQDFAARFPTLILLRQDARTDTDFAALYEELVDWHVRLDGSRRVGAPGHGGLADGGAPQGFRELDSTALPPVGPGSGGGTPPLRRHRSGVAGPTLGADPGVLRGSGLHASGPVAGHRTPPGSPFRDRGAHPLLDPSHGDSLRTERLVQRGIPRRDRPRVPGLVEPLGRRREPEHLRGRPPEGSTEAPHGEGRPRPLREDLLGPGGGAGPGPGALGPEARRGPWWRWSSTSWTS